MLATDGSPIGPHPFTLLFDDTEKGAPGEVPALPGGLRDLYGGDWRLPEPKPYIYANFAISRDGRVSFALPGHLGGGDVSSFSAHDRWLMALLRARADAVLMGDATLRLEPEHLWTCEYIYPEDSAAFAELRRLEERRACPYQVFLSLEGEVDPEAAVLKASGLHVIVATTTRGSERTLADHGHLAQLDVLSLGEDGVDLRRLVDILAQDYGVKTLLCEGGPRTYGSMLAAKLIQEEFLTLCPTLVGNDHAAPRPGLVEGAAFTPDSAPRSRPVSLRRAGDYLFLRSSYVYAG